MKEFYENNPLYNSALDATSSIDDVKGQLGTLESKVVQTDINLLDDAQQGEIKNILLSICYELSNLWHEAVGISQRYKEICEGEDTAC